MLQFVRNWWFLLAPTFTAIGGAIWYFIRFWLSSQARRLERAEAGGEEMHSKLMEAVDGLEEQIEEEKEKRRAEDQEIVKNLINLRRRLHERFITEKQFQQHVQRLEDLRKRVQALDEKVDKVPQRTAELINTSSDT